MDALEFMRPHFHLATLYSLEYTSTLSPAKRCSFEGYLALSHEIRLTLDESRGKHHYLWNNTHTTWEWNSPTPPIFCSGLDAPIVAFCHSPHRDGRQHFRDRARRGMLVGDLQKEYAIQRFSLDLRLALERTVADFKQEVS